MFTEVVFMGGGARPACARASGRWRPALMNETNACCWLFLPFFCNMAIFDGFSAFS